jgi:hypothetical protein
VATEEEREALIGFGINEAILAEINQQSSQSVAELVHGFGQWLKIVLFFYIGRGVVVAIGFILSLFVALPLFVVL